MELKEGIAEEDLMLTTKDNPYNPKVDYEKWRIWDIDNGYHTEEFLSRLADIPDDVEDDIVINLLTNEAIQNILDNDYLGVYMLV